MKIRIEEVWPKENRKQILMVIDVRDDNAYRAVHEADVWLSRYRPDLYLKVGHKDHGYCYREED